MNKIEFNKHMSDEFGIYIENIPSLPTLTKEYEATEIAGRNGSLTKFKGYKDFVGAQKWLMRDFPLWLYLLRDSKIKIFDV